MCNRAENLGSLERTLAVAGIMAPPESYLCFQNIQYVALWPTVGRAVTSQSFELNRMFFTSPTDGRMKCS